MKLSAKQTSALKVMLSIAATVLACFLLQIAFSLFYWLPTRSVAIALRPSVDAIALAAFALMAAYAVQLAPACRRAVERFRKALLFVVPLLLLLCVLLGIAEGVALREFGYHFMLAYHTSKVGALFLMMHDAQSTPVFIATMAMLVVSVAILVASAAWALSRILKVAERGEMQRRCFGGALLAYAIIAGLTLGSNASMSLELARQVDEVLHREERLKAQAKQIEKKMKTVRTLKLGEELRRPTVLVFVVESYGQVLMEAPKYDFFRTFLNGIDEQLSSTGYHMRSTVYRSPVFGGSSWLANATILCRLTVPTEKTYFSLMKTKTRCLPTPFNEAGYHSVFAASNTTEIDAQYSTHFPFETFYPRDSLGYKGPRMSWSYMPDQYVIHVVEEQILSQPSERPHFVYYKLSSSHHPWDTIPPYIDDWESLGDGSLYATTKNTSYPDNAFLGGRHYNEGYEDSIRYSLETIVGYLNAMPEDRDVLAIVLGDHQPRRPVAIMDRDPWTVPLHVITRDAKLSAQFERQGFSSGLLVQARKGLVPGLELLAEHLFRALNDVTVIETQVYE